MGVRNESEIHGVDVDALVGAITDRTDGPVFSLVEYDREGFNPLFVSETTLGMYEDEAHMQTHFERIHGYVNLDLTEMSLFTEELLPQAEEVRALSTTLDMVQLVRVYVGGDGFFVAVQPDEPVPPITDAVRSVYEGPATAE